MMQRAARATRRRSSDPARKRRSAEEIRGRLLSAAREEFGSKSFAGATTAAIAKRADVAEAQMFRYFPSKADLFREAIFAPLLDHFRSFNDAHAAMAVDEASARQHASQYIVELQTFLEEHEKDLMSLFAAQVFEGQPDGSASEDLQSYFSESVRRMSERSRPANAIAPDRLVRVAFATLLGYLTYRDWLFPDELGPKPDNDEAVREFILQGVGPLTNPAPKRKRTP